MNSHGSAGLNIANLVVTSCSIHISVKESSHAGTVLREVRVLKSLLPLLIVVNNMISVRSEEGSNLLVLEDGVEEPNFIEMGFHTFITNTGEESHEAADKVNFPERGLREHHE